MEATTGGNNTSRSTTIMAGALLAFVFAINAIATANTALMITDTILAGIIGASMIILAFDKGGKDGR